MWSSNGIGFIIVNEKILTKSVLPKYFKHSNYSSFIRQVNIFLLFSLICMIFTKSKKETQKIISIMISLFKEIFIQYHKSKESLKRRNPSKILPIKKLILLKGIIAKVKSIHKKSLIKTPLINLKSLSTVFILLNLKVNNP